MGIPFYIIHQTKKCSLYYTYMDMYMYNIYQGSAYELFCVAQINIDKDSQLHCIYMVFGERWPPDGCVQWLDLHTQEGNIANHVGDA